MKKTSTTATLALIVIGLWPNQAWAMHISEGILSAQWAAVWFALALPFIAWGLNDIKKRTATDPGFKALVAMVGAAIFIISCMPIPVPAAGTCSHPCGTGLGAILIGPGPTIVVASIALLLQALFLAHGGLTTLGADVVSMGIGGALTGYWSFRLLRKIGVNFLIAAFAAGVLSDWATYLVTSLELALAFAGEQSIQHLFAVIMVAFMPTQIPLGVLEGFLCAGAYRFIYVRRPGLLNPLTGELSK